MHETAALVGATLLLSGGVVNAQYMNHQEKKQKQAIYATAGTQAITITADSLTYDEFVVAINCSNKNGVRIVDNVVTSLWNLYQGTIGQTLTLPEFVAVFKQEQKNIREISIGDVWLAVKNKNDAVQITADLEK